MNYVNFYLCFFAETQANSYPVFSENFQTQNPYPSFKVLKNLVLIFVESFNFYDCFQQKTVEKFSKYKKNSFSKKIFSLPVIAASFQICIYFKRKFSTTSWVQNKERIKRVCICLYFFTPLFVFNCSYVFDFCLICLNCLETPFAISNDSNKLFELFELVMNMFVNFQAKSDDGFRFK
jgi:hypothetical protein